MSGRQIKELYYKVWSNLRESEDRGAAVLLNWDEKSAREEWGGKRRYGLCGSARESWEFFSVCVP
ncbi:CIC_collapsed_G0014090.mRNA.1.CDS.1 [Saccharomyces cerevisiae]|nr:CIC_collapsed_G0014090.mRNA.1.CDS.1 [Saccharomyces cerevisiae]